MKLLPVLLAGGSGTRLWPLSRSQYPKQFLKLTGEHTLLQQTALRAAKLPGALPPLVICNEQHRFLVAEQLREIGVANPVIVLEPEGRNTAPAAAIAAWHTAQRHGAQAQVFLMAADHVVRGEAAFLAASALAAQVAATARIVTFGITPTHPETAYGYIRCGQPLGGGGFEVAAFIEKPAIEKARSLIADGGHYWNGGLFLFRAGDFLTELERLEPAMCAAAKRSLEAAKTDLDFIRLDAAAFAACRSDSIDYAVMEKTGRAALVPLDAGWDDVGSWSFLGKEPADAQGNVARGDVLFEDSGGNRVHATSRLVALAGVRDHVVVETPDAVLVTTPERAQDVKKIVARLSALKRPEAGDHPKVYRPWGSYETIALAPGFQVKRITVKPGQKLSLQKHHRRAEHWIVVKGTARVTCSERVFDLQQNQSTFIPLGEKHRLENCRTEVLELIEVQCGDYLGEDDIVRFDDVYGRAK